MINNLDIIKDLVKFEFSDEFLHLQILKRKKENPDLGSNSYVVKTFYVRSWEYLESKMPGNGEVCQSPYRICRPSYEEVIREIYAKDVDAWHAELQQYIVKWAR